MKNKHWILVALSLAWLPGNTQSFSGRTNDMVLDYKNPTSSSIVTNLPVITWTTPKMEYTNSQASSVLIEATIVSDIEIKSVKIGMGDGTEIGRAHV